MRTVSSRLARDLEALRVTVEQLAARVAVLEAGRGPRDAEDQALVVAIGVATKGLDFSASALCRHASVDPALSEAFEAADVDIDSARQVGKLLRRIAGHDVAGWRVEQVGTDRKGIRWRLRVCEFDTPQR